MGSEKYPNENGFDAYLGKHGGSSDAYTDCEQVTSREMIVFAIFYTFYHYV